MARDKLPPTAGRGSELLPIPLSSGCCWTRPWVALKSFGSGEIDGRWLHHVWAAVTWSDDPAEAAAAGLSSGRGGNEGERVY